MIKVALTGGIGSGKTFVAKIFESLDVPVYYADIEAKRLMWRDPQLKASIKTLFSDQAYHRNGRINRAHIAQLIFNDKKLLKSLNRLVHPAVHKDVNDWYQKLKSHHYAIEEAALIFESGNAAYFDKIITVAADKEVRIRRVMKRDKFDRKTVLKRMQNQLDQDHKIKESDYIIYNDGNKGLLKQIWDIHNHILKIKNP